jgi:hypothetical protein
VQWHDLCGNAAVLMRQSRNMEPPTTFGGWEVNASFLNDLLSIPVRAQREDRQIAWIEMARQESI